jgi:hypothetical protein
MQFKVPQFLEIEDKIFGPFTFREFVYLVGGVGLCFVLYKLLGFYLGLLPILAVAGLSLLLTFYKPNSKPFINMLEASVKYAIGDKLFIWKRRTEESSTASKAKSQLAIEEREMSVRLGRSKLRDLAWSLDVLDLKKQQENPGN